MPDIGIRAGDGVTVSTGGVADPEIVRLLRVAGEAGARGDAVAMASALRAVLLRAPDHPEALNAVGMQALSRGDHAEAEQLFARATLAAPSIAPLWMNLATARRNLRDDAGERAALEGALATDQRHLMANVRLAELHERSGEDSAALFRWSGVVAVAEAMPERPPGLDQLLMHARARVTERAARFGREVDDRLSLLREGIDAAGRRRFDACVDAMLGRRRVYRNEPHGLHFPFLPADEFFDRAHFPWLGELEAAAPVIRRELKALLAAPDSGFAPYVDLMPGSPVDKWTPLDRSDAWSARYLWQYGERQADVCDRCPETAAALARAPLADMPGKGPTAFFSVLKPGARLPAHTGVSNIRAIVHLPLIVPPGCGFRVGGETRHWVEGEAFAFDDTIEHEAWNESDAIRAVLILDVWNPHLSAAERDMLRGLFRALATIEDVPATMGAVAG
ncbi:MAG TPA: aspartyl/asparaginyl beta-hydroxylase domain-containing protein [Sphingomonas sp.]|uniref:aspartyl/asparaginyl beta-hydroxylase domain-containing protein n=1 Tax=Sphingomonas sp. TaxID=28214 RepID=UPI002EDA617C